MFVDTYMGLPVTLPLWDCLRTLCSAVSQDCLYQPVSMASLCALGLYFVRIPCVWNLGFINNIYNCNILHFILLVYRSIREAAVPEVFGSWGYDFGGLVQVWCLSPKPDFDWPQTWYFTRGPSVRYWQSHSR